MTRQEIGQNFIYEFTRAILITLQSNKTTIQKRQTINSDLIPSITEEQTRKNLLVQRKIYPLPQKQIQSSQQAQPRIQQKQIPLQRKPFTSKPIFHPAPQVTQTTNIQKPLTMPVPQNYQIKDDYGKITPLLRDPTVSSIECNGAGQNLTIIRAGQRQFTKISLNPVEIKEILEKIAQIARVPLMEGVFKAAVENFMISAVVSSIVGSRFIIKKQTPYSLLEEQG